jgi:F-type H+-transporting ATPase subunit delta
VLRPHRPHARRPPAGTSFPGPSLWANFNGRAGCAATGSGTASLASGGTTISTGGGLTDRYAAALYSLADDQNALDAVVAQMDGLGRLIDQSPELRRLLASPLVDVNAAQRALREILVTQGFGKLVQDFVGVVVGNRRTASLRAIIAAFAAMVAQRRGVVVAEVQTAHPLTDLQEQQLRARLIESGYGRVDIVKKIDPGLLGGLVVKIGARLFDSSLKSRLQRLQYAMKGAA